MHDEETRSGVQSNASRPGEGEEGVGVGAAVARAAPAAHWVLGPWPSLPVVGTTLGRYRPAGLGGQRVARAWRAEGGGGSVSLPPALKKILHLGRNSVGETLLQFKSANSVLWKPLSYPCAQSGDLSSDRF